MEEEKVNKSEGDENGSSDSLDLSTILKAINANNANLASKLDETKNDILGIIDMNNSKQNMKIDQLELKTQTFFQSRVIPLEKKMGICEESVSDMNKDIGNLGRRVSLIDDDLKETALNVQALESKVNNIQINPMVLGGKVPLVVQQAEEKPKFDPFKRTLHPVKFLKKLERYLQRIGAVNDIEVAIETLEGDARIWAARYEQKWQSFEEFKRDFIHYFWSQEQQEKIRASVYEPRQFNRRNGNFSHHVWYWVDKAQHLEPPVPEKILVSAICKHFPYEIETALIAARVTTIDELLEVLSGLESRDENRPQRQGENSGRRDEGRRLDNRNNVETRRDNWRRPENRDQEEQRRENYRVNYVEGYNRGAPDRGCRRGRGNYRTVSPNPGSEEEEERSEN
ncbi:hypothetical protein RI129_002492 [Pyrocoelia pectoralis]|uniref:Uncharacterized protein n=1 Tax=Pyrocoelia pectoralis TaxID=417401 RepID=A0AAN7ZHZ4_9COLE